MPLFEYEGLNAKGKNVRGSIDSESIRTARVRLKQQQIFLTKIREAGDQAKTTSSEGVSLFSRGVSTQQLALMTRQLATLVGAGIPLVESLRALGEQLDNTRLRRVVAETNTRVNEGSTLADALRAFPAVFPKLYTNLVASGEASGSLEVVLERLADFLEAQASLKRTVLSALAYPVIMIVLCIVVVMVLLAFVVPQITEIFIKEKLPLPVPTRFIIALSAFVQEYWLFMLAGGLIALLGFNRYGQTKRGRAAIDSFWLKLPIAGPLVIKVATARFARTLGTMLTSGTELLTALGIVKNIVGNVVLEDAIETAISGVREGQSLAVELSRSGIFPRMLIHMIAIGEKTGQLEQMLIKAATNYESEVNAVVQGLTRVLEPVLILVIAVIVALILAAVMLPLLEMNFSQKLSTR